MKKQDRIRQVESFSKTGDKYTYRFTAAQMNKILFTLDNCGEDVSKLMDLLKKGKGGRYDN